MNDKDKETLMDSVINDDHIKFKETFDNHVLVLDDSYFDYELLKAALVNRHEVIANFLISKGCRVKNPRKINLEETPLHLAMKLEDLSIISAILLNNDSSIYDKNFQGDTPLYAAFKESHYSAVSAVLDYISDCNLNFKANNKDDILHFHIACIRKHITSVQLYLSLGFDVNIYLTIDSAEFSGLTPLHYLISTNDYDDLFKILLKFSDLTVKNGNGLTPLHSIYYNYNDDYNVDDGIYYSFELYNIMALVFKHGNDTKFINVLDNIRVSHFHLCCSTDYPEWVKEFFDSGIDINSSISFNCSRNPGFTALHFAAKHACVEVVELLLENGADCNKADKNGITPLHSATQIIECDEQLKIIDILLEYSACSTAVDRFGNTPIHLAFNEIFHNISPLHVKVMNKLISKIPLNVNLTNKEGLSFFHIVCTRNYPNRVRDYLNSGIAIDSVSNSPRFPGYTALHFAVAFNQKDVVEVLLKRNAQVTFTSSHHFNTPLHLACECTSLKFYEVYYEYKKKSQTSDETENLDWIPSRTKQLDIIKLLLSYGADIEAKNYLKYTPLFLAFNVDGDLIECWSYFENSVFNEINTRLIEITNILLSNNANIRGSEDHQCGSIFHVPSKTELPKISDELMECLLTASADINAVDNDGLTPLHVAVRCSRKELVQSFLKHKANINIKCNANQTPLELAVNVHIQRGRFLHSEHKLYKSSQSCIGYLLEYGSDVNIKTSDQRSFLHTAASASCTLLIENLLYYGADINVEDSSGNSPVSSLLTNGEINNYCKSLVSEDDKSDCLWNAFDQCIEELNRMEIKNIDNYTSMYHILLKNSHELSKHVRNKTLIEILEAQDIDETFPLYSYLLKLQYKRGLLRRDVLKEAKSSLIYITSSNLPEACYDSILRYLTNEEVVNLKIAAAGETKRKLSDNYSNEAEPSIKLQKKE